MTKVLVADDSSTMRAIIVNAFRAIGVSDIVEAFDGHQAVELFHSGEFDLAVIDWFMPGKTGLQVLTAIRDSGSEMPVLIVTAAGSDRDQIVEAIDAGATDYLLKPFHSDSLRKKLEEFCRPISDSTAAAAKPARGF